MWVNLTKNEKKTIGVILLNLGGPDSLQAIRPFLYNLFSDRKIIRLGPSILQKPIAWLISSLRSKKTKKMYQLIGGRSPILDITIAQANALEEALNNPPSTPFDKGEHREITNLLLSFKVLVGMRYWHPFIEEVVPEISRYGTKKLIAISMYPHYSYATTGSSISRLTDVLSGYPIEVASITSWFDHPLYIDALIALIKKGLESFTVTQELQAQNSDAHIPVLFSAHNLPEKLIKAGDPYVNQVHGTIQEIIKKLNIEWHLSYQSKSGPVKWLEPSTEEIIKRLAESGFKNILLVPISFVSDHIETLFEIDVLYKDKARKLGVNLKRVDSLNIHPLFIEALKDLVIKRAKEEDWI